MAKLIFSSKQGLSLKHSDISQAVKYFDKENGKEGSKIIIPQNLAQDKRKIEQAFGRKVVVAPIKGDRIHISNEQGV